jgi:endonuclease/exonuclease/phosphatase family metal-dependent hydrolase
MSRAPIAAVATLTLGLMTWWMWDDDEIGEGHMRGEPSEGQLSIVSYNVCFERPDARTVDALAELDADVVLLQETNEEWQRRIDAGLADRYPTRRFHHHEPDGGLGLLSKLPVTRLEERASPVGAFPAWCVELAGPRGPLRVLAVHLHPPLRDDSLIKGYFMTGGDRHQEIVSYGSCFDGPPDLAIGDFNEREGEATKHLETLGMRQAQHSFPPAERTWRWPTSLGELSGRPDHVFVGPRWRARAVRVPQVGASDHWPLLALIAPEGEE